MKQFTSIEEMNADPLPVAESSMHAYLSHYDLFKAVRKVFTQNYPELAPRNSPDVQQCIDEITAEAVEKNLDFETVVRMKQAEFGMNKDF